MQRISRSEFGDNLFSEFFFFCRFVGIINVNFQIVATDVINSFSGMGKFAERKRAAAVIIEAVYGDGIEIGHFLRFGNFESNTVLNLNLPSVFLLEPKRLCSKYSAALFAVNSDFTHFRALGR